MHTNTPLILGQQLVFNSSSSLSFSFAPCRSYLKHRTGSLVYHTQTLHTKLEFNFPRLRFVSTGPPGPCHYDLGVCFKLSLLLLLLYYSIPPITAYNHPQQLTPLLSRSTLCHYLSQLSIHVILDQGYSNFLFPGSTLTNSQRLPESTEPAFPRFVSTDWRSSTIYPGTSWRSGFWTAGPDF